MRLGASAFTAFGGSIEAFCELLRELGLERCELRNFIGGDTDVEWDQVRRIKDALDSADLKSTVHAPWKLNLAALDLGERDHALRCYERAVDIAAELGSDVVVFHGGWVDGAEPSQNRDHALRAIAELVRHAASSGVSAALENDEVSRPTLFRHPTDFQGLDVPELNYVLDLGHAHTMGYRAEDFLAVFSERLAEVHLHDNDGTADQHLPIGRGTIDWQAAAAALRDHPEVVTVLECKSVPCLEQSIAALKRVWRF